MKFDWDRLWDMDKLFALDLTGGRDPDLVIGPNGEPYLYRWHILPRNKQANVYFHVQVASDPERPLHDHPWDCTSVILSGGYDEILDAPHDGTMMRVLRKGDMVHRKAEELHRLVLPHDIPYTMTLFTTGPKRRQWGFQYPEGWVSADLASFIDSQGMARQRSWAAIEHLKQFKTACDHSMKKSFGGPDA